MGLAEYGAPADEYEPEAELIIAALVKGIQDKQALRTVIESVFAKMFDTTLKDIYIDKTADEIWTFWKSEHQRTGG